ncbi:MAG TPA: glycine-rich protein, partial [Thermomicrobiaceae bacterium]|nr:glycine-rich protein [Thermomicrobiaceae bacterium]
MNHHMPERSSGPRFFRWVSVALLAASLALAAPVFFGGAVALADTSSQTATFGCIGFPQLFGVPPGVTQITVNAAGAAGGFGQNNSDPGYGSTVSATLAVTPRDTLQVTVGCQGSATAGGYGGFKGGDGNSGNPGFVGTGGGGGGGATVIEDLATGNVLLVAAGGGGGGGNGIFNPGGNGGTYVGIAGSGSGLPGSGSGAGNGGIAGAASGPDGESNTQGTPGAGGGGGGGAGYPNGGLSGFSGGDVGGGGGGGAGVSFVDSTVVTGVTQGGAHSFTDGSLALSYTGPDATPQVYGCTNDLVRYFVPAGVTEISAQLIGADGGNLENFSDQLGGQGAGLQGIMRVTPGQELFIAVGCHGQPGSTGHPGDSSTTNPGGAGGYGFTLGGNGGAGDRDSGDLTNGAEGGCGGGGSSGISIPQAPPSAGDDIPPGDQLI